MLVLAAVTLLALDRAGVAGPLRSAVGTALAPVQRSLGRVVGSSEGTDAVRLRAELAAARIDAATAAELRALRLVAGATRVLPTRVVALAVLPGAQATATIGLGTGDGVQPGMTVIDGDGLVGRVRRAGPHASVVLLAVDPTSAVGVRLAGSGEVGLCRGAGRRLRLQLRAPHARVAPRDAVVTGPAGATTYVPGLPVGRVRSVSRSTDGLLRSADVQPAVDFTALDLVGVLVP